MNCEPKHVFKICITLCAIALGSAPALAESNGYAFLGSTFGGSGSNLDAAFRYGAGGSVSVLPHVTLGAEIGGLQKDGAGLVGSAKVGLQFKSNVEHGFDPFINGGFTYVRKQGEGGAFGNVGGGLNYWFQRRLGIRAEFVGYPAGADLNSFSEFRIGIVFR